MRGGQQQQGGSWSLIIVIVVIAALLLPFNRRDETTVSNATGGIFSNVRVKLTKEQMDLLTDIMDDGKVQLSNTVTIDLSTVQTIEVSDGVIRMNPPARVNYDGPGILDLSTTITEARLMADGEWVLIDLDHSPVDVEVRSE